MNEISVNFKMSFILKRNMEFVNIWVWNCLENFDENIPEF